MHADINLTEIALVALAALGCGVLFERIRQPAVLGYILAGVLLGPSLLGLVESREFVSALAELGVLMLLFLVGMGLSLRAFKTIWHVAVLCTLMQFGGAALVILVLSFFVELTVGLSLVLACSIALSSTAVAIKILESIGELRTETGRITVGVLIAQDLALVPVILMLRGIGGAGFNIFLLLKVVLSIALLAGLIFYLSRGRKIRLPFSKIVAGNEDLTPLVGLAFCFGMAFLSGLFELSAAYGAFLGGLILGNTTERQSMIRATQPIQSVLMMVFFLSIGLLMDLQFMINHLGKVLFLLLVITIGKTLFNVGILNVLGQPRERAFLAGLVLAQMGEFAFLLSTIGIDVGLLDADGTNLIVSLAALSLFFSPLWLSGARRILEMPASAASTKELFNAVYGHEISLFQRGLKKGTHVIKNGTNWAQNRLESLTSKKASSAAADKYPHPQNVPEEEVSEVDKIEGIDENSEVQDTPNLKKQVTEETES